MKDNILLYQDYREFLQAQFDKMKKSDESFTYKSWAKLVAPEKRHTFFSILIGDQIPSKKAALRIADYFKFSDRETRYFGYLVDSQRVKERNRDVFGLFRMLNFKN